MRATWVQKRPDERWCLRNDLQHLIVSFTSVVTPALKTLVSAKSRQDDFIVPAASPPVSVETV